MGTMLHNPLVNVVLASVNFQSTHIAIARMSINLEEDTAVQQTAESDLNKELSEIFLVIIYSFSEKTQIRLKFEFWPVEKLKNAV